MARLTSANIVYGTSIFGVAGAAKHGASGSVSVAVNQTSITVNCGFQPAHLAVLGVGIYGSSATVFDNDYDPSHLYYGSTTETASVSFTSTGFTFTFAGAPNAGTLYWIASQ